MSIQSESQIRLLISDFANSDAGGKLNIIGGAVSFLGSQQQGLTSPFSVSVIVNVPSKFSGQQYALTLELYDETRKRTFVGPGPSGPEALRVQQVVNVQHLQLPPEVQTPSDAEIQHIMVMNFANGIPLPAGTYDWKAQIDGQSRPSWYTRFHVLGAAPGPIFGGPVGPADIGGIKHPFPPVSDDPQTPEST